MKLPVTDHSGNASYFKGKAPDCAIGAFIGLNGQNTYLNNPDLGWVSFNGPEW
jgi:hypothetical protein